MTLKYRIMENTLVYRLWQAPFAEDKLAPILSNNDLATVHRILEMAVAAPQ